MELRETSTVRIVEGARHLLFRHDQGAYVEASHITRIYCVEWSIGPLILLSRVVYVTRKPPFDLWGAEKFPLRSSLAEMEIRISHILLYISHVLCTAAKYRKTKCTAYQTLVELRVHSIEQYFNNDRSSGKSHSKIWAMSMNIHIFTPRRKLTGIWIALLLCRLSNSIVFNNLNIASHGLRIKIESYHDPICRASSWLNHTGKWISVSNQILFHPRRSTTKQKRCNSMDLLLDTQKFGLRMRRECRERFPRYRGLAITASRHVRHARTVMHVGITKPWWRGKRSRHSRRMRNP